MDYDRAQISFHEATIMDVKHVGTTVSLWLQDVVIEGAQKAAEVAIEGVDSIFRDKILVTAFKMEEDDGEILTLRAEDNQVALVVEWNNFAEQNCDTVVYTFRGSKVTLQVKSCT